MKPGPKPMCIVERIFRACVLTSGGCIEFSGSLNHAGYGSVGKHGARGNSLVHRVVYEHFFGPLGEGLELDHLCRNRRCCRLDHLEAVDRRTNVRRANGWYQDHGEWFCPTGHAVSGSNVLASNCRGGVSIKCRKCWNEYQRTRVSKRRAAAKEHT